MADQDNIVVPLSPIEKTAFENAAKAEDLDLASWMRNCARSKSVREIKAAVKAARLAEEAARQAEEDAANGIETIDARLLTRSPSPKITGATS